MDMKAKSLDNPNVSALKQETNLIDHGGLIDTLCTHVTQLIYAVKVQNSTIHNLIGILHGKKSESLDNAILFPSSFPVDEKKKKAVDPKRSASARKAWETIRAKRAMNSQQSSTPAETSPAKSKKIISGIYEWAHFSMSCYSSCENLCTYCWAQADKIQKNKKRDPNKVTPENRHIPVAREWKHFVNAFRNNQRKYGKDARIMTPGTHDITMLTIDYFLRGLKYMLDDEGSNHTFLIVTKARLECIKKLCEELNAYKGRIMFRFTIGSADDKVLAFWEPEAPKFQERLDSLKYAYANGYATSVSCEPRLDANVDAVINATKAYVSDSIWIGTANKLEQRLKLNGCATEEYLVAAKKLEELQALPYIQELYSKWKDEPKIRWKASLKEMLGLPTNSHAGMDI